MMWMAGTRSLFATLPFQFAAMSTSAASSQIPTQLTPHPSQTPYQAPLRDPGGTGPIVPGNYGVYFFPGHSIEQHSAAIKTDITPHLMHIFDKLWTDHIVYSARNIDRVLLAVIRSDRGSIPSLR
ncbi:hypothetical protein BKA61DRAFT_593052 [Leptodontidium sp. MPI-SDFR-AT-0119]|nr:hypothetical protein BKA61DRAFT_593052 [Leptodontidium sp. MPI-SDFR-AT-0119]